MHGCTRNYEDPSEFVLLLVANYSMTTSNVLRCVGESLKLDISNEICIFSLPWLCMGCCEEDPCVLSLVFEVVFAFPAPKSVEADCSRLEKHWKTRHPL